MGGIQEHGSVSTSNQDAKHDNHRDQAKADNVAVADGDRQPQGDRPEQGGHRVQGTMILSFTSRFGVFVVSHTTIIPHNH